jgi:MFS family permease
MCEEWNISQTVALLGITTFCSGFAIAPMILAPFSEITGRYGVFVGAGILFVLCQAFCAITTSFAGMLLARFWAGVGSSVFSTMVGGVVSDLYDTNSRNTPMALFSGFALFGTGLGPLVSGFIAQNMSWRYIFYLQIATCGAIVLVVIIFFEETRGSILLSRKAKLLNKWYDELESAGFYGFQVENLSTGIPEQQRIRWKVKSDEERASIGTMIRISVYRPFHLLTTEPVVFFFSLWVAFAWAVLYLTFGSIPLVFSTSYGFDLQQSNAIFAAMSIGAAIATLYSVYQDRLLARYLGYSATKVQNPSRLRRSIDLSSPEGRLYFACLESIFLPIGLFWFGWSSFPSVHWIVPAMSVACATMGIYSVYLATFNYLADSYGPYASSALAAQSFCRNMLGGIFPLVTIQLFNNLSFQGAGSLLGGLAALLTLVPWVLVFYGKEIRARSKFASGLA